MKIFIINLRRNFERKQFMQKQLENTNNICYEFVEAIDGQSLDMRWKNKICKSNFYNQITGNVGFSSPNEIACFASHYTCWEKCLLLNEPCIILEDDVLLLPEFINSIENLEYLAGKLNYVRLMVLEKQRTKQIISDSLWLYTNFPCGTQGYVITPKAAKKFIKYAAKFHSPVDMYLDRWYLHGLRAYCVNPELIKDEHMTSNIGTREKIYLPKPKGITKLIREIVRPIQKARAWLIGKFNPIISKSILLSNTQHLIE